MKQMARKVITKLNKLISSKYVYEKYSKIDTLIKLEGTWKLNSNEYRKFPTVYPANSERYNVDVYGIILNEGKINLQWGTRIVAYHENNISKIVLILEYTKATD